MTIAKLKVLANVAAVFNAIKKTFILIHLSDFCRLLPTKWCLSYYAFVKVFACTAIYIHLLS